MIKILLFSLMLAEPAFSVARGISFAWDNGADWPSGTTVELCGNGVCENGLTGTQHTLDVPVNPGEVFQAKVRAITPDGRISDWGIIEKTWPSAPVGFWALKESNGNKMAASIVSGSETKRTQTDSFSNTMTGYSISSGTDLALFVIVCGNFYSTTPSVSWNPGSAQSLSLIVSDNYGSWGMCGAFVVVNPTPGTGSIAVTGLADAYEDSVMYVFVASGVNQSTPTSDAAGDSAGTGTSKTLSIANMTAADLAVAAISIDNDTSSLSITNGNNIGADSIDFVTNWTDAGAAYNTGTGTVDIVFGKATANGGALKFRIVGSGGGTSVSMLDYSITKMLSFLAR